VKLALVYDTETQGLPLFKEPSEHPGQPHLVQLGAALIDLDTRVIQSTLDVIVKPEGWTIPEDVAKVHGITTERALDVGVPESLAVEMLEMLWRQADLRIAHNEQFDARIIRIAMMRHFDPVMADEWKAGAAKCTQLLSTPILKLPPT
jgi:DNA polymerase III subunit epsilon